MRYRFGSFELDEERFQLVGDERAIRLEPRVFETLGYLVANAGRLVTRDELVETIWQGRHVTDAAVSRAVAEARRALREAGSEQAWIETVYGRGFVFSGEVERIAEPVETAAVVVAGEPLSGEQDLPIAAPIGAASEPRPTEPAAAEAVTSPPTGAEFRSDPASSTASSPIAAPSGGRGSFSWHRGWPWLLPAAIAVLVAIWVGARGESDVEAPPSASSPAKVKIAVLPFAADGGGTHTPILALSLAERVALHLGRQGDIDAVPPERAGSVGVAAQSPAGYRDALGVDYLLEAVLRERPSGDVVLFATLGEITGQGGLQRTPLPPVDLALAELDSVDGFTRLRDQLADDLVDSLLPALPLSRREPDGVQPEAYRLHLEALQLVQSSVCDMAAVKLVERALQLDPDFGAGWLTLAWTHYMQLAVCTGDSDHYRRALTALGRARELDPEAPSPVLLESLVLAGTGRVRQGLDLLTEARRRIGDHPHLLFGESFVLRYAGRLDEARARVDRLLEIDPGYLVVEGWAPNVLLYLGEYERFRAEMPAYDTAYNIFYRAISWTAEGNLEQALAVLELESERQDAGIYCDLARALEHGLVGDRERARRVLDGLVERRHEVGASDGEMTYKIAQLYAVAGERASAQQQLDLAVEEGFVCAPCFERDPLLIPLRGTPEWTVTVEEARRRAFELRRVSSGWQTGDAGETVPVIELARLDDTAATP